MKLKKLLFLINTIMLVFLLFVFFYCDGESITLTMKDAAEKLTLSNKNKVIITDEKGSTERDTYNITIIDGYPMFDPFHKVFEPSEDVKFPEGVNTLDVLDIDDKDIKAIYYPLVSEEEKNEFYHNRFGSGRALNIKIIVRQENFDKRLIRNEFWYPYPKGVTIKGTIEQVPPKVLSDFKYWEESGEFPLPPLLVDDNPILINVTSFIPNYTEDFEIKVGVLIENKDFIEVEKIKEGVNMAWKFIKEEEDNRSDEELKMYKNYRPQVKIIFKEANNTEDAKKMLNELYEKEKTHIVTTFTSNETEKELIPIAEKYKELLFTGYAYDDELTGKYWNRYAFKITPNIYQRAFAVANSFDVMDSKIIVVTEKSNSGQIAYEAIEKGIKESGRQIVKHIEIDNGGKVDYDFPELKGIKEIDATHLLIFWDIMSKSPENAINYSPISVITKEEWKNEIKNLQVVFEIPSLYAFEKLQGIEGFIGSGDYNYQLADTHLNDYILERISKPDTSIYQGFTASYIAFKLLANATGNFDVENLIALTEDREFITPKRFMKFRKEDHQALHFMFNGKVVEKTSDGSYILEQNTFPLSQEQTAPPIKN